jgi:taurine dioxygenase
LIKVRPTGAALGAEIQGVDLSHDLDDATFKQIVDLWHEHEVIFFRDQKLTPAQHVAFSRRFGELELHVRKDCCRPGYHELFVVSNIIVDGKPIGSQDAGLFWHSDLCYLSVPSRGSLFYALEVPHDANGKPLGDTKFASSTAAYNALSPDIKNRIEGRKAVQSYKKGYYRERNAGPRKTLTPEQEARTPDVAHPIVRTHPFNGKKCLFVNDGYTAHIAGMEGAQYAEGEALLNALIAHSTKPEFIYQHSWRVGDFLLWDNCLVQHQAVPDYQLPMRRHMERTTLTGTAPF